MCDKWSKLCRSRDLRQETLKSGLLRFYQSDHSDHQSDDHLSEAAFLTSMLDGMGDGVGTFTIGVGDMQLNDMRDAILQWKKGEKYNPVLEEWLGSIDPTVPAIIGVTKANADELDKETLIKSLMTNVEFYITSVAFPPAVLPPNGKAGMMIVNDESSETKFRLVFPFYFRVEKFDIV